LKKDINKTELESHIRSFIGKKCIYRENELYIHSEIHSVDLQDWEIWIILKDLNSPGFTGKLRRNAENELWKVGASWEAIGIKGEKFGATYSGWTIFFNTQFIKAVCQYAETLNGIKMKDRPKLFLNCVHQLQYKKSFLYIKK